MGRMHIDEQRSNSGAVIKIRGWPLAIAAMVAGISLLHYMTNPRLQVDQVIYAKLYYIPVIIAALLYGLRGGLLTAGIIALIYGPSLALKGAGPRALIFDFTLDLAVLLAVGILVGVISGREREQHRRAREAERLASLGRAAAMMAHEMKAPLIAIGGFAGMLLRRCGAAEDSRQELEVIKAETARLERLVRDALDFNRLLAVRLEHCPVKDLLDRTRDVVRIQARSKGVRLIETCDTADLDLRCDQERITQVLVNLLDNAIHYTAEGGEVRLSVSVTPDGLLNFEVCDSGRGIPEHMLEKVFEPFEGEREGGSGLGLAIAQGIIRAHGSRIMAVNAPGGGASFSFRLPGHKGSPASAPGA
ncbi:MAG: HAMP domain-containing sensor histidine kinase [bacterium]